MVKDAYKLQEELGLNPKSPLKKWSDAIVPHNASLFIEYSDREEKWINWPIIFPMNDKEPGTAGKSTDWELIRKILGMAMQLVVGDPYEKNQDFLTKYLIEHLLDVDQKFGEPQPKKKIKPHWWSKMIDGIKRTFQNKMIPVEVAMLHKAAEIAENQIHKHSGKDTGKVDVEALEKIVHLFPGCTHWFEKTFSHAVDKHDKLRRLISVIEWMEVTLTGILDDVYDPEAHTFNYQKINHCNYLDWLEKHGASDLVLDCALVRFMYTGAFANLLNGGTGKLAADIGLQMVMLSIDYKGCLVWKLTAGTADTIIIPIYQVLRQRGVKLNYFHKIQQVHHSDTGKIEKITVAEQVKLREGVEEYDPFLNVNGLNSRPAAPLCDQLDPEQAKKLKNDDVNLEITWSKWENYREYTLEEAKDFDQVLLGIPVAALKHVCSDIVDHNTGWKNLVE